MSLYRKILVPVDGSPASMRGLREAARLALGQKSSVVLLHIVDAMSAFANVESAALAGELVEALIQSGRRTLKKAEAQAKRLGIRPATVLREKVGGPAAYEIVRQAKRLRCDLIVIGTHGRRGVRRLVFGSDAELVVRNAPVPVLLVRAKPRGAWK